ncbi:MAG TPA: twin transmembrane helix small protein [Legionellaceae bacterium]|nr:twin transmembrane helix small protein [Legionellaceae bacterium]
MFTKIIVITTMLIILGLLTSGLVFLVKDKSQSKRTVIALTWRIGLSILLFLFLFLAFKLQWLIPHAI